MTQSSLPHLRPQNPHAYRLPLSDGPNIFILSANFVSRRACTLSRKAYRLSLSDGPARARGPEICLSITKNAKNARLHPLAVRGGAIAFLFRIFFCGKPYLIFFFNQLHAAAPRKIVYFTFF